MHITPVAKVVGDDTVIGHSGQFDPARLRAIGLAVADALEKAEPHLTDLDSRAGDGDLGASMLRGAEAIRALPLAAWDNPAHALASIGDSLRRAIAGSSGPFYAIALTRAGRHLADRATLKPEDFAQALAIAAAAVGEIGGAKAGDRTMLDALLPAQDALAKAAGRPVAEAWKPPRPLRKRGPRPPPP